MRIVGYENQHLIHLCSMSHDIRLLASDCASQDGGRHCDDDSVHDWQSGHGSLQRHGQEQGFQEGREAGTHGYNSGAGKTQARGNHGALSPAIACSLRLTFRAYITNAEQLSPACGAGLSADQCTLKRPDSRPRSHVACAPWTQRWSSTCLKKNGLRMVVCIRIACAPLDTTTAESWSGKYS
ncbi:MAG: hypothetical protein JWR15_270 [Prosthecobacter sp.]|nr:hypothetical protein [Prosthecobacter sp.]